MCYLNMYTTLWPTGDRKIELRRWILACIFFNRLNIKVQYPVENNRAKNFIWEWKCHQFLSTILFPGPLLPNMQRLDGTRDPFSSDFLVIIIQYEGPVHNPLHYLSQSLRLYKDIEEEDTNKRNVCSTRNHNGWVQSPKQTSRAEAWRWELHSALQPSPPLPQVWRHTAEVNTSTQQSCFVIHFKIWSSCLSEEATV